MPPPPPRCVICHDDLSDTVTPYATTCGHLCCEDCATFHFSFDKETPCPFCRTLIKRDQLFRLYFDFNSYGSGDQRGQEKKERAKGNVAELEAVTEACRQVLAGPSRLRESDIQAKVEETEVVLQSLEDRAPHLEQMLRSLGLALADIKEKLQELRTARAAEADSAEVTRIRQKYQHKLQKARKETESTGRALQDAIGQAERERDQLQQKLGDALAELDRTRRDRDGGQEALEAVTEERNALRSYGLKYKKKYTLLKQSVENTKRLTRPPAEDDSLMIIE